MRVCASMYNTKCSEKKVLVSTHSKFNRELPEYIVSVSLNAKIRKKKEKVY